MLIEELKLVAYVGKLYLHKKNRTKQYVKNEYNDNTWNKKYDKSLFDSPINVHGKQYLKCVIVKNNKLVSTNYSIITPQYLKQLDDTLLPYINEHVIEFGCGFGSHLFRLKKLGFKKLSGYDISTNAINLARTHNEKINSDISFDVLDLTEKLPDFTDKVIFTHLCLEQLKHSMSKVIQNMVDSNPKLIINFETDYDRLPFLSQKYHDYSDYQNNFVRELCRNFNVDLDRIVNLPISLSPLVRVSVIIWKPIKFLNRIQL